MASLTFGEAMLILVSFISGLLRYPSANSSYMRNASVFVLLLDYGARQARDHTPVSLDIERSLEDRDPPGDKRTLSMLNGDAMVKVPDIRIGNALLHSHELEAPGCQCRCDAASFPCCGVMLL
jgi:hypothetical protein